MVSIGIPGMIFPDIQVIFFDKDGTLIDVHTYWAGMIGLRTRIIKHHLSLGEKHEQELMIKMGVNPETNRILPDGPVGIKKREIVLSAAVDYLSSIGFDHQKEMCEKAFEEADQISLKKIGELVKPINGAENLLRTLKYRGCKVAIATTDRSGRAALAFDFLHFSGYIDLIIGADMVHDTKPNPEMLLHGISELHIQSSRSIMVGDADTDVQMGVNAGILASIGVLSGISTRDSLTKITPHVIRDVSEIQVI